MSPVAVTEESSMIMSAIGETPPFLPLCFSLAEGIIFEGYSKQKTSLYILNSLWKSLYPQEKYMKEKNKSSSPPPCPHPT